MNQMRYKTFEQISFADMMVYSKLPLHSFWSHIESKIDFSFADRLCSVLYTGRGQHPYAPSLKLKILLVQTYYDLSDRQTEEKIIGDLFIKRFLGLPVDFFGFDHSTIGLDRSRMGTAMFQACHLYILAQMYSLGLWGDREERWIIDSFPTHVGVIELGAYRLIQQASIRLVNHLKRSHSGLYHHADKTLDFSSLTHRLSSSSEASERLLAFSKLVAFGHALLHFFETEQVIAVFQAEVSKTSRLRSLHLQQTLSRILQENSRPTPPNDDTNDPPSSNTSTADVEEVIPAEAAAPTTEKEVPDALIEYEKIPRKERPVDRLFSATHTDVRIGRKNASTLIKGFKTQNLSTENGVVLNTKVIAAYEHDRDAMFHMVNDIQSFFSVTPHALLGDTAYGDAKQRILLEQLNVTIVAPVVTMKNPTSLYDLSHFSFNEESNTFSCPNGQTTYRKNYNKKLEGTQYFFRKEHCASCPFQAECTTNEKGRSVFRSDYADVYKEAAIYNESPAGKMAMSKRYVVERKNQEMKNNCGIGSPRASSKKTVSIKATLAAITVNLKLVVRLLIRPKPGFLRRAQVV